MAAGDKLLAGIESNKIFLKKHLSRKRAMKISYGISTLIYLSILTVLIVLTTQAYNLYNLSDVITNGSSVKTLTETSLATIKSELGVSVDDKLLLLGLTVFFAVLFISSLSFYISLSKMNYTARPKLWLGTSIILLPLVIPFIICIIVFIKYIKDKHWKESRKDIKKTIQPILSGVIKEFEEDVLRKEVNVKRISNEHPGFDKIYESIKTDANLVKEQKQIKKENEKPTKLTKKEKKALKKQEKEEAKKSKVKVDESQITDEVENEVKETPSEDKSSETET